MNERKKMEEVKKLGKEFRDWVKPFLKPVGILWINYYGGDVCDTWSEF